MKRFHCFWVNPYGMHNQYEVFDQDGPMLELVKQNGIDGSSVRGLRVVWGELLEFEPATVVETYRIKAS